MIDDAPKISLSNIKLASGPSYEMGQKVATRLSYGTALAKLAKNSARVIALDGDTKNSTYSDKIKQVNISIFI
jgi:transketolase